MASPHLPGFLSTLPLPLFGVAFMALERAWLPARIAGFQSQRVNSTLLQAGAAFEATAVVFLVNWFAAVMVWMWNKDRGWKCRPETLSILRSPATGEPLHPVPQSDGSSSVAESRKVRVA